MLRVVFEMKNKEKEKILKKTFFVKKSKYFFENNHIFVKNKGCFGI